MLPLHDHHKLTLVSHALCPYVQRVAIALLEKGIAFERIDIDLAAKPDWFLAVSPLGKTPVLLVEGQPLFESSVICEYLEETRAPRLHPADAVARARERGWMEFASVALADIATLYNAADEDRLQGAQAALTRRLIPLESALAAHGWFSGERFGLVDAAFAPVFRYMPLLEQALDKPFLAPDSRLAAWAAQLAQRASVRAAVSPAYPVLLRRFLAGRPSALAGRLNARSSPAEASGR